MAETTSNPLGTFTFRDTTKATVNPPAHDVVEKQDPKHTEADFASDLAKATRQKPESS